MFLKTVVCKLERSAVFRHVADEFVASAIGQIGLDFDGYFYARTNHCGQVLNDFLGNA